MVRGRATARGTRRGAAAATTANDRPSTEANDATSTTQLPASVDENATSSIRRGGATARASRGAAGGRFRPRNIRREEAERDDLARQEEKKASDRAADERRARGRSRFRSKRSRGDAMGSRGGGGFGRPVTTASGPFASGMAGSGGMKSGGWFGIAGSSGGAGGRSGPGFKSDSKGGPGFGTARESREMRINADRLHVMTPTEELNSDDEDMMAALGTRSQSVLPMGIYRRRHKEAEIVVATTAELEAAENATGGIEDSLWVDSGSPTPEDKDKPEEGVWETDPKKAVKIKKEPGLDEDTMDLDTEVKPAPAPAPASTKFRTLPPRDPEDAATQQDMDLLTKELGAITVEKDGNMVTELGDKDGRLYLFQFPPLLPPLKPTSASVKAEPSLSSALNPLDIGDNGDAPVDLTLDNATTTKEEEEEVYGGSEKEGFRSQLLSHGGMIGKLNVRKSGKVELSWGGRILEMGPAASMNFLTTAVIVEESDEKPTNNNATGAAARTGGDCVGMGKIMGRFTLAPVWSEEEEWIVSPEELELPKGL